MPSSKQREELTAKAYELTRGVWSEGLIEFERAFDAPASREAMCASQRALP